MGQPPLPQQGHVGLPGKLIAEAALLNDPSGLAIPVIVIAPDGLKAQLREAPADQYSGGLRDQTPTPEGGAEGIAQLIVRAGQLVPVLPHKAGRADHPSALPVCHRKHIGGREHGPNDLPAVLHAGVGRPPRDGPHPGIPGIVIQLRRVPLLKGTEQQAGRGQCDHRSSLHKRGRLFCADPLHTENRPFPISNS